MHDPADAPRAFQAAWNQHDMQALRPLFHADATFVNRFGHYVRGIDAIVDLHAPIHATIYADSTLDNALTNPRTGVAILREQAPFAVTPGAPR